MNKIEKTFNSETRSGLKIFFNSENVGIKIKGTDEENSVLYIDMEYSSRSDNEYEISDFLTMKYNKEDNEMHIEFKDPDPFTI